MDREPMSAPEGQNFTPGSRPQREAAGTKRSHYAMSPRTSMLLLLAAAGSSALMVVAPSFLSMLFILPLVGASAVLAAVLTGMPDGSPCDGDGEESADGRPDEPPENGENTVPGSIPDPENAEILMAFSHRTAPGQMGTIVVQHRKKSGRLYPFRQILCSRAWTYLLLSFAVSYLLGVLADCAIRGFTPAAFFFGLAAPMYLVPGFGLYICARRCQSRTVTTVVLTVLLTVLLIGLILLSMYNSYGGFDLDALFADTTALFDEIRSTADTLTDELSEGQDALLSTATSSLSDEDWDLTVQLILVLLPAVTVAGIWLLSYLITFVFERLLALMKLPHRMPVIPWTLRADIFSAGLYAVCYIISFFASMSDSFSMLAIATESLVILLSPLLFILGIRGIIFRIRVGGRTRLTILILLGATLIFMPPLILMVVILSALGDIVRLHFFSVMLKRRQ